MKNEKSQSLTRDILDTVRDCTIEDACTNTARVIRKYRVNTDNETLAIIAQDAFCDYLDACIFRNGLYHDTPRERLLQLRPREYAT